MQRDVVQDLTDKADEQWKSLASLFADGQVKVRLETLAC